MTWHDSHHSQTPRRTPQALAICESMKQGPSARRAGLRCGHPDFCVVHHLALFKRVNPALCLDRAPANSYLKHGSAGCQQNPTLHLHANNPPHARGYNSNLPDFSAHRDRIEADTVRLYNDCKTPIGIARNVAALPLSLRSSRHPVSGPDIRPRAFDGTVALRLAGSFLLTGAHAPAFPTTVATPVPHPQTHQHV